ncbi:class I SAM-dependent methyltransferase [Alienimonas chondri]|uniref:Ubiquinone/menaquinone biosynthesis C-methyltransferase UbiE n=1 Tax=Alienimonas chondri TaxID=2681879 RepID=A0ABX1VJY2_9PLAN|nr:class I SAM-dependent methyltransferase [Alienimonas chondri]NNJ27741.1 Ubiquinone/menaquinone biosynthesis C-methyltransferase UbiE [Alienimonas chondri]
MPQSVLPRTPEAEVTASAEDAAAYDRMDHTAVNRAFVDDLLAELTAAGLSERLRDGLNPLRLLDVGTGAGRIPIELGRRPIFARMILADASEAMLARAKKNVFAAGLQGGIRLRQTRADDLPFEEGEFHAVVSNSLLHHLTRPAEVLREAARTLKPGGLLFFRDLVRPRDAAEVDALVAEHAANEEPAARELLRASLHAAYTPDELTDLLAEAGVPNVAVRLTSDRHVTLSGCPRPAEHGAPEHGAPGDGSPEDGSPEGGSEKSELSDAGKA